MPQPTDQQPSIHQPQKSDPSHSTNMSRHTAIVASITHDTLGDDKHDPRPPLMLSSAPASNKSDVATAVINTTRPSTHHTSLPTSPTSTPHSPNLLQPSKRPSTQTVVRLTTVFLALLSLILNSTRAPAAFNDEYIDDGAARVVVFLDMCSAGGSLVCSVPLLIVPRLGIFRRAFPFRHRPHRSPTPWDDNHNDHGIAHANAREAKPRLHPGLTLTFDLIAGLGTFSLQLVSVMVGYWAFDDAAICMAWIFMSLVVVLHGVSVVLACRDVHALRAEQRRKRSSLTAPQPLPAAASAMLGGEDEGFNRGGGLQGWVELTEQHQHQHQQQRSPGKIDRAVRTGGVGGGLSGVGRGF